MSYLLPSRETRESCESEVIKGKINRKDGFSGCGFLQPFSSSRGLELILKI